LAAESNNFLQAENHRKNYCLAEKLQFYFSTSFCKNVSLNLHYHEIIFDRPGITLLHRQVLKPKNENEKQM